jgi:mono/diheme cytochrome c family protein
MPTLLETAIRFTAFALLMNSTAAIADDPAFELGQKLYADFCTSCHGADKDGLNQFSDDKTTFTERLEGMTENMPDFADVFEANEVDAMYAYLDALREPKQ